MLQMLGRNINSPQTSSAGRLFDAIAAWVGLGETISFEGQVAMGLEFAIADFETDEFYPVDVIENPDSFILDWKPMVLGIIADLDNQIDAGFISAKFHNSLAEAIVSMAGRFPGIPVALTGGCFQNRYLSERTIARLRSGGVAVYCHSQVPPNDGGLAVGQAMAIARLSKKVLNYRTD
jgi:hydrogenase maturation protein HypF